MQSLDLSWNGLEDAGAAAVCRALASNQVLKSLDIASCRAGVNACVALGEALRSNTSLQELSMAKNLIGQVGAGHVMAALTSNHTLVSLTLKVRLAAPVLLTCMLSHAGCQACPCVPQEGMVPHPQRAAYRACSPDSHADHESCL